MKLIDGEKLHDTFVKHYKNGGKHKEAYLDCAYITELSLLEPIEAIPIEWLKANYQNCNAVDLFTVIERWEKECGIAKKI